VSDKSPRTSETIKIYPEHTNTPSFYPEHTNTPYIKAVKKLTADMVIKYM